jgi:hypothetical protein
MEAKEGGEMITDWPETRRTVEVLAQERGFTVEAVAEEMEKDRRIERGEVLPVLKGARAYRKPIFSCPRRA